MLKKLNGREVTIGQLSKAMRALSFRRALWRPYFHCLPTLRRQGAFFGEIAVLYDMPRTATVRGLKLCQGFRMELASDR